jgi:hypothetical protein
MSKQTINIGASPNDGTGTPLRTSFDYTNQNFTEIYTALGGGVALPGATTQVIFNDGGTNLAGDAGLVYNKTTDALTVAGLVTAGSATITGAATVGTTLGVTGVSTLASAVVTGALTVDTTTLVVDPTNNRVGIGTATPNYILDVLGSSPRFHIKDSGTGSSLLDIENGAGTLYVGRENSTGSGGLSGVPYAGIMYLQGAYPLIFGTNFTERYRIDATGVATWSVAGTTAMTLNSTGLGIGMAPLASSKLSLFGGTGDTSAADTISSLSRTSSTGNVLGGKLVLTAKDTAFGNLVFRIKTTASSAESSAYYTDALTIDGENGNIGVGVTPTTSRLLLKGNGTNIPVKILGTTGDTTIPHLVIDKKDNDTTTSQLFIQFVVADNGAGSGQINANGVNQAAFGTYSDSRLKKNIVSLPSQLANILSLRPVEFDYKDSNGHQIGFIAQEMQEVYADAVGEQEGFLTVSGWNKTEARLVSAIKELAAKVQALEAKLA